MSRLNENQVERLLKEAASWEPDAQMPESLIRSALTKSPRRRMPLLPTLSLCSAACAGVMAFLVLRPEVPSSIVVQPTPSVVQATPEAPKSTEPSKPAPVPAATPGTQVADNTEKPSTVNKPSSSRRERRQHRNSKRNRRSSEELIRNPRREVPPVREEYAPDTSTNEPKPLPENAISLDESPKVVPVVVADTDPETGEVLLRPAAALVSDSSADAPISLE